MSVSLSGRKARLRADLRSIQKKAAGALGPGEQQLIFLRPPNAVLELVPEGAVIGLYHPMKNEVPTARLARWFAENGHSVALPRFSSRDAAMEFVEHTDPFAETDLEPGPFAIAQPTAEAPTIIPHVLFAPLLGFTARGERIGQGAGHYDRWLAAHPETVSIGLAWDAQEVDDLPTEPHDVPLSAVLTPSRLIGPFA